MIQTCIFNFMRKNLLLFLCSIIFYQNLFAYMIIPFCSVFFFLGAFKLLYSQYNLHKILMYTTDKILTI